MSASECLWCGERADDEHHLTGRDPHRQYLDEELTAPLCHSDHELAHDELRLAGIDTPPTAPWSAVVAVEFRLKRLALFLGGLAEHWQHPFWERLAAAVRSWADELHDSRAAALVGVAEQPA